MSKITDNSNELSFHQLTSTSSLLLIPLFQRPYVWTQKQLDRMIEEIEAITEAEDGSRFLGAVIAVTRPTNPSQPTPHEIVDGQQRLTTLYLFLLAAAQAAARDGHSEYARGLISTNLIVDWAKELPSNTKLQPSIGDRSQFRKIFDQVSKTGDLADWLPVKASLPGAAGDETGSLVRQYARIQTYLKRKCSVEGFEGLSKIVEAVRNSMTFVFILLKDPGSATTVFEGLNDPGVPISVGDLVKNEVFARVGYDEPAAQGLHDSKWVPFRNRFGDSFDDFFFPYCVVQRSNASRTEMFGEMRKLWGEDLSAKQIIEQLEQYADPFLTLHGRVSASGVYGKEVGASIERLVKLGRPSSIYPFVMRLLKGFSENQVSKVDVVACIVTLESFLVRRAICGIEPTGLLGLFRTLWSSTDGHPTAAKIESTILKRLTVEWPSDQRLREAVTTRPIYESAIAKYVIVEYDRSLGVDHPAGTEMSLEHVMPASYCDQWSKVVTKAQHAKLRHLWANLVPLSKAMNALVAQSPFEEKRKIFAKESMFTSTRQLADSYSSWGEIEIEARSESLVAWAKDRWKRPADVGSDS